MRAKTFLGIATIALSSLFCETEQGGQNKLYKGTDPITPLPEYTAENPREWASVAEEHIPQIKLTKHRGKKAVLVTIPLKKSTHGHYIEKLGIMDKKRRAIVVKSIVRTANPGTYAYFFLEDLPSDDDLKAFGKCNLHDLWTASLSDVDL